MLRRTLSLRDLSLACAGQAQTLTYGGGTGYSCCGWDYIVTVPAAAQTLSVCATSILRMPATATAAAPAIMSGWTDRS